MPKSLRSAQLVLNTANFYTGSTNSASVPTGLDTRYGTADTGRVNCTFSGLDWQTILGDLYSQYSSFSIALQSFSYLNSGGTPFATPYPVAVYARGLPWVSQCYNVANKSRDDNCQIYCGALASGVQLPHSEGDVFLRPSRYQDFTLAMYNAQTGLQTGTYDRSAIVNYVFKIYGVDKV
jgi:hypothetical protein